MSIGALVTAVITTLKATTSVTDIVGDRIYEDREPQGETTYPYLVVSHDAESDLRGGFNFPDGSLEIIIVINKNSNSQIYTLSNIILDLLNNKFAASASFGHLEYNGHFPVVLHNSKSTARAKGLSFITKETY